MKMRTMFLAGAAFLWLDGAPALGAGAGADADLPTVVERESASMNELPRLVRETLEQQAGGGGIAELQKELRADHSMTYDAEIVREGKVTYVNVASDGTIVGHAKPQRLPRRTND